MSDVTCRGSFALGTACGRCSRCRREIESYNAMKFVRDKLNTPSSAISRIEELEAKLAKAVEEAEKYQRAFAAQSRKLQAVLHIEGVRATLAELTGGKDE